LTQEFLLLITLDKINIKATKCINPKLPFIRSAVENILRLGDTPKNPEIKEIIANIKMAIFNFVHLGKNCLST
jgi:hypothetical protein